MTATATSPTSLDVATVESEGAAQSVPPAAQAAAPEAGRTEEDTAGGSSGIMAVVERTSGGLPSALVLGAAAHPRGVSRRSTGWIPKTQRRLSSRSTTLPRA